MKVSCYSFLSFRILSMTVRLKLRKYWKILQTWKRNVKVQSSQCLWNYR